MPKIHAVDARTGQAVGEILTGRVVKANTNANPTVIQTQPAPVEGQNNKTEGAAPEAKELPPQYEALARKESALRTREKEFQVREAALKSREVEIEANRSFKEKLKQSPLEVLNELGITYDQLVEQAVNTPDPATRGIQQELKTIRETQAKLADDAQKASQAQRESAVKQIQYDAESLVNSDPAFETIKATESISDVVDLIVRTFDETGRLMQIDEAAKLVEEELFQEAMKIASLGKVKAKLTPALVEETKQPTNQKQSMTTLTNNMASTKPLSARDRAIRAFKGEKF